MHRGYVHLWRKTIESSVWERGALHFQIWSYILIRACGVDTVLPDGRSMKRGQLVTSYGQIRNALKTRRGRGYDYPALTTVKHSISWLLVDQLINLKADHRGLFITVIKYDDYNPLKNISGPISGPIENRLVDGQLSTLKKLKEGKEESKPLTNISVVGPAQDAVTDTRPSGVVSSDKSNSETSSPFDTSPDTPPPEAYALARRFEAILSIHLGTQGHHVSSIQAIRRQGRLTDEHIATAILEGAKWIVETTPQNPWNGILGILKRFDPSAKRNGRAQFECPEHGLMTREGWSNRELGAELVYKCRHADCTHPPNKTGKKHIDQPYSWEPKR